jgi:cell wall assembly regulator SMI1
MTSKFKENIKRILSWARENAPQTVANLNKPASMPDMETIESECKLPLPAGFRELWSSFDGDGLGTWLAIFGNGNQMLSCKELVEHYRLDREIGKSLYDPAMHKVDFWKNRIANHVIFVRGAVKPLMLHPKWLPFTSMNGDVIRYFDFDPAPGGTAGQIIEVDSEGCSYQVLADSLDAFVAEYANELESGVYSVAEDGFIESTVEPDPFEWGMPGWLKRASG